ncbi:phenylacetate--CoA ligase family protein [Paucibacter sp. XJ19-41]|uniref:phenylacetate--CoA ligase family protein n=1 Tax=Paucibacter sp. XJ19-41 TaxID=2927824 RepID=UPI00234B3711|nr:AMP-binding protein [Paucibacter sp. XJ19-41]MDC6166100.1 AMP-binding protein [Paucibacter sp. XJ19-41]
MPMPVAALSSIYTGLVSKALFPLHERLKGHDSVALRQGLERSQWLAPAELQALQLQRLNSLLAEVGQHVPYYRELFQRLGLTVGSFASLAELQQLPLLGKAEIRAHTEAMKSTRGRSLARFNTGGSSGEPLIFFIGKERVSHDVAAKWRATRWWGVDIGDPEMVVWGSPIELGAQDRLRAWRDRLLRTELLPAFEMNVAKLDGFVAAIRRKRPSMLFGYPSALSHIARHARERGVAMDDLGIQVAFVTSERLYDEQRGLLSEVFGCPVANGYGGRDAGFIAHQCPSGGMHLTAEDIIVELLDREGRPVPLGTAGEIVVTHLATSDFPFIRYRTGDIAVMDERACACGRGLPMLKEIQGRSTDFVIAADGTVMHGLALIYILRDLPGLRSFKVVQHSRELTEVLLVPEPGFDPGAPARIVEGFKKRLGVSVAVEVRLVDAIPTEKSGKFRYIVSHAS